MTASLAAPIKSPPWVARRESPDLWVSPARFGLLMKRSKVTVIFWIRNGTLRDFRYSFYRDPTGRYYIRISPMELVSLKQLES